jgi:hypothetical protein
MNRPAALFALQQSDSEIRGRQVRLMELERLLAETDELREAKARLADAEQQVAGYRSQQRDLEARLKSLFAKRQESEDRLYGGLVRNPKELSDLQNETASLERRKSAIEDQLLQIMLNLEDAEDQLAAAAGTWTDINAAWTTQQANCQAEIVLQQERLDELANVRQSQLAVIPPADLQAYEHLRQRRAGVAVVRLVLNECQGCMTTVSAAKVKEAHQNTLSCCGTCGRFLFAG